MQASIPSGALIIRTGAQGMYWRPLVSKFAGSVAVLLLVGTMALMGRAHPQDLEPAPTKDQPVLELDLRKLGYEPFTDSDIRWQTFVDFTDDNHQIGRAH